MSELRARPTLQAADLFCGAGGTSTGLLAACREAGRPVRLTAINHWPVAVATHSKNHPDSRHLCASLDSLNPRDLYADGELDLLWASPECTHHSNASGGKPIRDQSRATAWCVTRWAEALHPRIILVENVKEFLTWGPLRPKGRQRRSLPGLDLTDWEPDPARKGEIFQSWVGTLRAIGYTVDWRILCAADYGDPTTRKRLFVQAVLPPGEIAWPAPTHGKNCPNPWRTAREIIDWKDKGQSIFGRKRPLAAATMRRIEIGLRRFGFNPSLVHLRGTSTVADIDQPAPTITAGGGHLGLVEPFLLGQQSGAAARPVSQPVPTVATAGAISLVQPFLVETNHSGRRRPRSVDEPLPTITCGHANGDGRGLGVCEPFLVKYYGSSTGAYSVDQPIPTITAKDRFGMVCPRVAINGETYVLDIRFRMLKPEELSRAQGFPAEYQFAGNRAEQTRQIGNAVPTNLAKALVLSAIGHFHYQ
jgi:DNA (cytosine-5)-methyltransferase 1